MGTIADKTYKLKSGYEMPVLGLGTWELNGSTCERIIRQAVEMGYKLIDTAEMYENENQVGKALKGLDRDKLFITSKVDRAHLRKKDVPATCKKTLKDLRTDYLDLYLIHWPNDEIPIAETMEAMGQLVENGFVRSIGLSNFNVERAKAAIEASEVPICVDQVEYHPLTKRKGIPDFCESQGINLTAYCPIARGKVKDVETIVEIGNKYGRSAVQVSLKWLIQKGHSVIPKAGTEEHLKANMDLAGWELTQEEISAIDNIDVEKRLVDSQYT
ncbi:MAG: aldo/keto reductase [Phycisphaerae bacterium]|jgi:diketogulonate reductase-like aldo/keto reductase